MYGNDVYKYADDVISHHGILGMKWGIRRYQKEDGSLTPAGKRRAEGASKKSVKKRGKTARSRADALHKNVGTALSKVDKEKTTKMLKKAALVVGGMSLATAAITIGGTAYKAHSMSSYQAAYLRSALRGGSSLGW